MALKRLTTVWKSIVLLIFSCANLGRPALYSFRGPAKERESAHWKRRAQALISVVLLHEVLLQHVIHLTPHPFKRRWRAAVKETPTAIGPLIQFMETPLKRPRTRPSLS